jgi:hypothetical protein
MEEDMTVTDNTALSHTSEPASASLTGEIFSRFRGPGGYYNIGNLIGLLTGLVLQVTTAATSGLAGTDVAVAYFVGSPTTLALTAATIIFLISGEMYHRAWQGDAARKADLNRFADLLSAAGAAVLAISLFYLGQPALAIFTGVLIVLGKLSSGLFGDAAEAVPFWPAHWPDLFRSMVLAGRIPGMAAAGLGLWYQMGTGPVAVSAIQPAVMVLCHLLWMRADILLFQGGKAEARPQTA